MSAGFSLIYPGGKSALLRLFRRPFGPTLPLYLVLLFRFQGNIDVALKTVFVYVLLSWSRSKDNMEKVGERESSYASDPLARKLKCEFWFLRIPIKHFNCQKKMYLNYFRLITSGCSVSYSENSSSSLVRHSYSESPSKCIARRKEAYAAKGCSV